MFDLALSFLSILLEAAVQLVRLIFSAGFLALYARGLSRASHLATVALAFYLLLSALRGFVPMLALNLPDAWFSGLAAGGAGFALILCLGLQAATKGLSVGARRPDALLHLAAVFLVLIGFTLWSATWRAPGFREELCLTARSLVPDRVASTLAAVTLAVPASPDLPSDCQSAP